VTQLATSLQSNTASNQPAADSIVADIFSHYESSVNKQRLVSLILLLLYLFVVCLAFVGVVWRSKRNPGIGRMPDEKIPALSASTERNFSIWAYVADWFRPSRGANRSESVSVMEMSSGTGEASFCSWPMPNIASVPAAQAHRDSLQNPFNTIFDHPDDFALERRSQY